MKREKTVSLKIFWFISPTHSSFPSPLVGEGRVRGVIFGNHLKNFKKSVKIEMLTENREEFFMEKNLFKLIGGGAIV